MQADDEVCLCFHVRFRKLAQHMHLKRVQRASQLADCQSAGTGCGWCRPMLEQLFKTWQQNPPKDFAALDGWIAQHFPGSTADYATQRATYRSRQAKDNVPQ